MHAIHRHDDRGEGSRIIDPEQELSSLRVAQEDALARRNVETSMPKTFELRPMTLNAAVAPLLSSPVTPFQKSERKKAQTSAMYYSECFLKGVPPKDADKAASDIQGRYNKWWIESGFHERPETDGHDEEQDLERKDASRFDIFSADDSTQASTTSKRPHHVSDANHLSKAVGRKRRRRRGGIRDMIQDNTVDPHDVAAGRSVTSITVDDDYFRRRLSASSQEEFPIHSIPNLSSGINRAEIEAIRDELVEELKANGGDTDNVSFQSKLAILTSSYLSSDNDARALHGHASVFDLDGTWLTLTKPTYADLEGRNEIGQCMYRLGRMSFDMFRPTGLMCSIQGTFNTIHAIDPASEQLPTFIPRTLRREVWRSAAHDQPDTLRTYNIVVAFTIEPNQTRTGNKVLPNSKQDEFIIRRPIRGIMTNYGYILPDPDVPNRVSVWFTGGSLEVNDEESDLEEWKQIFDENAVPRRDMREFARLLAAKVLLGANTSDELAPDGTMNYTLKRPIGGHGSCFCDVLYLDDSLRIMRGHHGSLYVFSKVISPDGHTDMSE